MFLKTILTFVHQREAANCSEVSENTCFPCRFNMLGRFPYSLKKIFHKGERALLLEEDHTVKKVQHTCMRSVGSKSKTGFIFFCYIFTAAIKSFFFPRADSELLLSSIRCLEVYVIMRRSAVDVRCWWVSWCVCGLPSSSRTPFASPSVWRRSFGRQRSPPRP